MLGGRVRFADGAKEGFRTAPKKDSGIVNRTAVGGQLSTGQLSAETVSRSLLQFSTGRQVAWRVWAAYCGHHKRVFSPKHFHTTGGSALNENANRLTGVERAALLQNAGFTIGADGKPSM